ncbi:ComF family protein [Thaumasiovibrio sp. DFM-14]|uniref:ComF family protein n=1 Tax=Thaumasiovibrio sp. DFM-14 TaxID=3384792 RepID=UPI0039A06BB7
MRVRIKTIFLKQTEKCHLCTLPLRANEHFCCDDCRHWCRAPAHCQRCGLPATGSPSQCGTCLRLPPLWQTLTAIGPHQFPLDMLIRRFKYQRQPWLAKPLAAWLSTQIHHPASLLLPVPMHWRRRLLRGYNQSALLSQALSQHLNIPVSYHHLKRQRHTQPQQALDRQQRLHNLKDAFALSTTASLPQHVALVDDVVTTGATANSLTQLLLDHGVKRVDIYCLSRTTPPQ